MIQILWHSIHRNQWSQPQAADMLDTEIRTHEYVMAKAKARGDELTALMEEREIVRKKAFVEVLQYIAKMEQQTGRSLDRLDRRIEELRSTRS